MAAHHIITTLHLQKVEDLHRQLVVKILVRGVGHVIDEDQPGPLCLDADEEERRG